jgi:L-glyceraldehyde 3-phosphate reductase
MVNRWIETEGLLDAAAELEIGVIGFTALAQGLLTGRYLDGIPEDSRAAAPDTTFDTGWLTDEMIARLRALDEIAGRRDQSLAQLALAWALRDERVTSLVIGASSVAQLEQNVDALDNLELGDGELAEIDSLLVDEQGVDLWSEARVGE